MAIPCDAMNGPAVELTDRDQLKIDIFNENELTRLQREYRNYANKKYAIKEDQNKKRNLLKNLEVIRKERRDLKSDLYAATGTTHKNLYEHHMNELELHVKCQEQLQREIDSVKTEIEHLNMQIKRVEKENYAITQNAMSENQYNMTIVKARKTAEILENRLDVSKKQECITISENSKMRAIIEHMLHDRALFNKLWQQMIFELSHDKKFLIDLVEHAFMAFNQGAELCKKLDALREKGIRDKKMQIHEMLEMIRHLDADQKMNEFLGVKGQFRQIADLEPREYKRRQLFRQEHNRKLNLFKLILDKVKQFSGVETLEEAIEKFNRQEDEYFAHFNYMNELNHQVEFLKDSLNRLYGDIDAFREYNTKKVIWQMDTLSTLNSQLSDQKQVSDNMMKEMNAYDSRLRYNLKTIDDIFRILRCDDSDLLMLLGDHSKVTMFNVRKFMTILELRMNQILSYMYYIERRDGHKREDKCIVRGVEHAKEDPTPIEDIVLVQQCAECAEGEDVNRYDEEIVMPMSLNEVRKKVREKVLAPEMQYRLHNISKCRLPRSRVIVNRRYQ